MTSSKFTQHVVDMRARPSFLHPFFGADPSSPEFETVRWVNRRLGSRDIDHFTRSSDLPSFIKEIEQASIDVAVMVGRSTPQVRISNDALSELSQRSAGRLLGVGSVDPQALPGDEAVREVRRCLDSLKMIGINVDPGFYGRPIAHDDETLFPIYAACEKQNAPVFLMSGPTTPDLRHNDPLAVDRVAKIFPNLSLICCHAFYPQIDAMLGVAFRHENVFVSPDMYLFAPGGERYVEAAKGFLSDQLLFGSSYPFRPIGQSIADLAGLRLPDEIAEKVAWRNAVRVLSLDLT